MDATGRFSLLDRLLFDPGTTSGDFSTLTVIGRIRGAIENSTVVPPDNSATITAVTVTAVSSTFTAVFSATNTFIAGDTVIITGLTGGASTLNSVYKVSSRTSTTFTVVGITGQTAGTYTGQSGTARVRELTMGLHASLNGSPAGLGIRLDENNYWFVNNQFKVGASGSYVSWDGTTLEVVGRVEALSGYIGNVSSGWEISSNTISNNTAGLYAAPDTVLRTNYIVNPSHQLQNFDYLFDGTWGYTSEQSFEISELFAYSRTRSAKVTITNTGITRMMGIDPTYNELPSTGTYTYSVYAYIPAGSSLAGRTLSLNAVGGSGYTQGTSTTATLVAGSWVRAARVITFSSLASPPVVYAQVTSPVSSAVVYFDAWMCEKVSVLQSYFDGSSEGADWTGTADISTSTFIETAFWAGGTNRLTAPVRIRYDGSLVSSSGTFGMWSFNAFGMYSESYNAFAVFSSSQSTFTYEQLPGAPTSRSTTREFSIESQLSDGSGNPFVLTEFDITISTSTTFDQPTPRGGVEYVRTLKLMSPHRVEIDAGATSTLLITDGSTTQRADGGYSLSGLLTSAGTTLAFIRPTTGSTAGVKVLAVQSRNTTDVLQEWRNSVGTVAASMSNNGILTVSTLEVTSGGIDVTGTSSFANTLTLNGTTSLDVNGIINVSALGGQVTMAVGDRANAASFARGFFQSSAGANTGTVGIEVYGTSTNERVQIVFSNSNGAVGSIRSTNLSTAYNTSSDYRLKTNVSPLDSSIIRLMTLKPYRFSWFNEPTEFVDGFFAHEVQEVVPEAITGYKDEVDENGNAVHQSIDQSKLVPLIVAALQDALVEIDALKQRVADLEA
jgi:hypothetical protein